MNKNKNNTTNLPEQKRSTHLPAHAVPSGTDNCEVKTRANCQSDLVGCIFEALFDYLEVLTFGFCFLTNRDYEPDACVFKYFPLKTQVELLRKLFHSRSQDPDYLELFDGYLKKFLDIETACIPVLERYLLHPQSVSQAELVKVNNCIDATIRDFADSMAHEHDGCPIYVTSYEILPGLKTD